MTRRRPRGGRSDGAGAGAAAARAALDNALATALGGPHPGIRSGYVAVGIAQVAGADAVGATAEAQAAVWATPWAPVRSHLAGAAGVARLAPDDHAAVVVASRG